MKKIFSIIAIIFCIFSFNINFFVDEVWANPIEVEQIVEQVAAQPPAQTDVLEEPVFEEEQEVSTKQKITGRLSSIIIKAFGGFILLIVVVICLSFIFIANEQRRREKNKKKISANSNVINAVDNFAKHRIKR